MNMDTSQKPSYTTVDFELLAKEDANFGVLYRKCGGKLDFQDPVIGLTLSQTMLLVDFNLKLAPTADRLCPPIPNRWNYVSWIHDLIDSTSSTYLDKYDSEREVVGLDIGSGASAIYTMLCLRSREKWRMCSTDIDKASFEAGAAQLSLNNLMTRTKLLQTSPNMDLVPLDALGEERLDFTICNPPFFSSDAEMSNSLLGIDKDAPPPTVCTGSTNEMVCDGGDLGFVTRILSCSLRLQDKVQWYTSMLGKLSSLQALVVLLKAHDITNFAVGSIDVGQTRRWLLAWSFSDLRPRNTVARGSGIKAELLPFPTAYEIKMPNHQHADDVKKQIHQKLKDLDLVWDWDDSTATGLVHAKENVWARAYRRAKKKAEETGKDKLVEEGEVKLVVRIKIVVLARTVLLDWVKGWDQVLWESFCGMMHHGFQGH